MRYILPLLLLFVATPILWNYSVRIDHISPYEHEYATYEYNNCMQHTELTGKYSCLKLLETFTSENALWRTTVLSNWNYWFCQLNKKVHRWFFKNGDYTNPYVQLDYCLAVWLDASQKNVMPWYANEKYDYKNTKKKNARLKILRNNIIITENPL